MMITAQEREEALRFAEANSGGVIDANLGDVTALLSVLVKVCLSIEEQLSKNKPVEHNPFAFNPRLQNKRL